MTTPGPEDSATGKSAVSDEPVDRILTIPNLLSIVRLLGSPLLLWLGIAGETYLFVGVFIVLAVTDWLDGKLAVALGSRSKIGPQLDTAADVAMYAALLVGALWLKWELWLQLRFWIGALVLSYAVTVTIGLVKFRRWPSYHTRMAKISWLFIGFGALVAITGWSVWPLRIATAWVVLTNLETIAITCISDQPRDDVSSVWQARRRFQAQATEESSIGRPDRPRPLDQSRSLGESPNVPSRDS